MAEPAVTAAIVLAHALVGWALCGAIVLVGRAVTTMDKALLAHLIGAPLVFAVLAAVYTSLFGDTTPLQTSAIFLALVILLDFFVVALLIEKSFDMFRSPIGTWIPFALIFAASYLTAAALTP